MDRFTVTYTADGAVVLFNLSERAAREIQETQTRLGARHFRVIRQDPAHYSQDLCDLFRPRLELEQEAHTRRLTA